MYVYVVGVQENNNVLGLKLLTLPCTEIFDFSGQLDTLEMRDKHRSKQTQQRVSVVHV